MQTVKQNHSEWDIFILLLSKSLHPISWKQCQAAAQKEINK